MKTQPCAPTADPAVKLHPQPRSYCLRPAIGRWLVVLLNLIALLTLATDARAATWAVTSAADSGTGSLRSTIAAAAAGDTIVFGPALSGQTIVLTSGELAISKTLNILGPGPANLTVSGNGSSRVFRITDNATCTLAHLSITRGVGVGNVSSNIGGAILNFGTLTLSNSILSGNSATNFGGAIHNAGTARIQGSIFADNSAAFGGGIYSQPNSVLAIQDCTLRGNVAPADQR